MLLKHGTHTAELGAWLFGRLHGGAFLFYLAATLLTALTTFEQLGSPLWADRARAELARTNVTGAGNPLLTPTEQRVAELAVQGMTNRDIGSALFISPKTVEANMTRIYRKLQIRSRAELGRKMARLDT